MHVFAHMGALHICVQVCDQACVHTHKSMCGRRCVIVQVCVSRCVGQVCSHTGHMGVSCSVCAAVQLCRSVAVQVCAHTHGHVLHVYVQVSVIPHASECTHRHLVHVCAGLGSSICVHTCMGVFHVFASVCGCAGLCTHIAMSHVCVQLCGGASV